MSDDDRPGPKQLTRNWNELLQELRVLQTGVQILTGFLLTVPFSNGFPDLDRFQVVLYQTVLCGAVVTTGFVVAPVAFHRLLFRQRERRWLVATGNHTARVGLLSLAITSAGVVFLVFDVTAGTARGLIAFAASLTFFVILWGGTPLLAAVDDHDEDDEDDERPPEQTQAEE